MEEGLKDKCRKYPGHEEFTRPSYFEPTHLPRRFRSLLVWSLICHKARLTVKLLVSFDRPEQFLFENSVRDAGSGYVTDIDRSDPDCVKITTDTAAHVVFDQNHKAASTTAQLYFHLPKKFLELLENPELSDVDHEMDVCRIVFIKDKDISDYVLSALEYALSPSVLPDVNNHMSISLLQSVVDRYQRSSHSWLSFLFHEIKCLKKIKLVSNTSSLLEIEIYNSPILLYDESLLILALTSRRDDLINLLRDIFRWNQIHEETVVRPFITLSKNVQRNDGNIAEPTTSKLSLDGFIEMDKEKKCIINSDFKIQQNEVLHTLMNCFINIDITSPVQMAELNRALKDVCQFDMSARSNDSCHIVFEIPVTSVPVPDIISLEVNLHDVKVEEEDDHIAVLISHPHDMPQQITVGKVERLDSHTVEYTTPSCPGSSGGQVLVIPKEITSVKDIEDIAVFTHSCVSGIPEKGCGHRL